MTILFLIHIHPWFPTFSCHIFCSLPQWSHSSPLCSACRTSSSPGKVWNNCNHLFWEIWSSRSTCWSIGHFCSAGRRQLPAACSENPHCQHTLGTLPAGHQSSTLNKVCHRPSTGFSSKEPCKFHHIQSRPARIFQENSDEIISDLQVVTGEALLGLVAHRELFPQETFNLMTWQSRAAGIPLEKSFVNCPK